MKNNSLGKTIPVLATFFAMGFCDIVGITSDYMQASFKWSNSITGFIPSLVFIWFLFLGIPIGNRMNKWGRKNTVLIGLIITIIGMFLPLIFYSNITCIISYTLLGIGNTILQISLNPLLNNVIKSQHLLASSLTAGQVIKAISSLAGPEIVLFATSHWGDEKWYYCFPIMGATTIILTLWLSTTHIKKEERIFENTSITDSISLLRKKVILILFLGIFFIVGVDVATNFISSKLMLVKFEWIPEKAKFAPQVYFFSRTIGAVLGAFLLTKIFPIHYFRVNIIACIGSILCLIITDNAIISLICIAGIGFFASTIFSVIYSLAFQEVPTKTNQISGLMITAVAGGGIVTPILGIAMEWAGITGGLIIILCCTFYLTFCSFKIKPHVHF